MWTLHIEEPLCGSRMIGIKVRAAQRELRKVSSIVSWPKIGHFYFTTPETRSDFNSSICGCGTQSALHCHFWQPKLITRDWTKWDRNIISRCISICHNGHNHFNADLVKCFENVSVFTHVSGFAKPKIPLMREREIRVLHHHTTLW